MPYRYDLDAAMNRIGFLENELNDAMKHISRLEDTRQESDLCAGCEFKERAERKKIRISDVLFKRIPSRTAFYSWMGAAVIVFGLVIAQAIVSCYNTNAERTACSMWVGKGTELISVKRGAGRTVVCMYANEDSDMRAKVIANPRRKR